MKRQSAGGLLMAGAVVAALSVSWIFAGPESALEAGFRNPPPEARLRAYWWWLNGNTTKEAISRDLAEMKAKGYGGALLVDAGGAEQRGNRQVPAGPLFGGPAWRELFRHALAEAQRHQLEISLNILSGWNLGGPTVKPEQSSKLLTWSRVTVEGGRAVRQTLETPRTALGFYRDVAVLAYPLRHGAAMPKRPIRQLGHKISSEEAGFSTPVTWPLLQDVDAAPDEQDTNTTDVRDVSAQVRNGVLEWNAPAGTWEILRIGYTCSKAVVSTSSEGWQGLVIDYLDREAFTTYWRDVVQPLVDDAKPYRRALRYLVTDSWELGGANWTPRFRAEFRKRRGYDLLPYLPVVAGRIVGDRATSNRFLNDFRRTIGDLVIDEHYKPFAELSARHGLGIHPESGGPHGAPVDALETLATGAFPQMEFWARAPGHRVRDEDRFFVKQASSVAHTYGKTLVAAEGPTSIGPHWEESLGGNLRPTIDQAFCEGLNRVVWHTFTTSPKEAGVPGQEYFAGTHLNPNVTWWHLAGTFLGYINRSQFLLQQGLPVVDVVYYYGDHVPNFAQLKRWDPAHVLPGYDFDWADEQVLRTRMAVRDGKIVLPDGMSYRVLALPEHENISLEAMRAVRRLVLAGATVVGPRPTRGTGLGDKDAEIQAIAEELWGKGRIRTAQSAKEALAALRVVPDVAAAETLDFIHRRTADADIYLIRNKSAEAFRGDAVLRVRNKAPEFWDAETGRIRTDVVYDFTADGVRVALRLDGEASVFVVLRQAAQRHAVSVAGPESDVTIDLAGGTLSAAKAGSYRVKTSDGREWTAEVAAPVVATVAGPWTVQFAPGWGAPARTVFDRLSSWTEHSDAGIRYFSGSATYQTRFQAAEAGAHELDLGEVREFARVRVNGRERAVLWKKPFRVTIDDVRAGWNDLDVEITNLWPNRLIGDQMLPPEQRRTRTNITKWTAESKLLPSGLLGPVTVRPVRVAVLR